jgi:predicted regulator of Ras-like GTPase activity (Roadblock/LC7/MglB family)
MSAAKVHVPITPGQVAPNKMLKFFKNFFASPAEEKPVVTAAPSRKSPSPVQPYSSQPASSSPPARIQSTVKPQAPAQNHSNGHGRGETNSQGVKLPLQNILFGLPMELKARIRQNDVGIMEISIPLEKVLPQLSLGSVKITFAELRHAAPQVFSSQTDLDQTAVTLPLSAILTQLNPALLFRRENQKHIEVPDEIRSPFSDAGQGLVFSAGSNQSASISPRAATPVAPASLAPPAPPAPRTVAPSPKPVFSAPPLAPVAPVPFRSSLSSPATSPPPPAAMPPAGFPSSGFTGGTGNRFVGAAPATAAPQQPLRPAPVHDEVPVLNVPLAMLIESWPETLRLEIASTNLLEAKLAIPVDTLKESLQRGRVYFPWKTLRLWLKPSPAATVSIHDSTALELPLKILAPLFVARQKDLSKVAQKVAIDETIPNLFFGFPQTDAAASGPPATASCAVSKPVDTNYYTLNDSENAPGITEVPAPRKGPSGTAFVTRCATPNEIVSRAAALGNVSGALIALPDGLMVASKLSPDLNGDTLAAFLPQIFGKVNQCTKELRMGELNNLNFTVGNVPWKIFRVNAIFFAAFGRTGQPLPTAELASLAGELDHKKQ